VIRLGSIVTAYPRGAGQPLTGRVTRLRPNVVHVQPAGCHWSYPYPWSRIREHRADLLQAAS
jgi:hypothetical protein